MTTTFYKQYLPMWVLILWCEAMACLQTIWNSMSCCLLLMAISHICLAGIYKYKSINEAPDFGSFFNGRRKEHV